MAVTSSSQISVYIYQIAPCHIPEDYSYLHSHHNAKNLTLQKQSNSRRHIKFRRRGITQKKAYNIHNTAKAWNQEKFTVTTVLSCSHGRIEKCESLGRLLNILGLGQGWWIFLKVCIQTVDSFQRNSFTCGNLSLLAPYFRLFQWRPRLVPWVAAWLVHPLV
jgi:hypothetical protein